MRVRALRAIGVTVGVAAAFVCVSAAFATTVAKMVVSGAQHGSYTQPAEKACHVSVFRGAVAVDLLFGPPNAYGSYGDPQITVTQEVKGAPTKSVNLSTTKAYAVEFGGPVAQDSWQSGWSNATGVSTTSSHLGSGTLTMSANGKSGALTTTMLYYTGSIKGALHVSATWNCAS